MYRYKEKYTIDFRKVKSYLEMHFIIQEALDWPDYYGCNWDAFWDLLRSECDSVEVLIVGFDTLPAD